MQQIGQYRNTSYRQISTIIAVGLAILLAGCGGAEDEEMATAANGLREINDLLDQAVVAYEEGDQEQALELTERAGLDIYETEEVEGVVAQVAPSVNRELDSLIEATIPGAVESGVPHEEFVTHVERARPLIDEAIQAIEEQ